jgi:hypothetical protein
MGPPTLGWLFAQRPKRGAAAQTLERSLAEKGTTAPNARKQAHEQCRVCRSWAEGLVDRTCLALPLFFP